MAEEHTEHKAREVTVVDKHGKPHHKVMVMLEPDDLVRNQVGGFVNFLKDYAVVGLAIGFIIGLQAQTVVKQLVESFVTPLLDVLLGGGLQDKSLSISSGGHSGQITWGKFVYVLVNFIFVMLFIYLLVKLFKLDKLAQPKDKKKGKK